MRLFASAVVLFFIICLAAVGSASAEVVYTPVNVAIPVGGSYSIDLNHDGAIELTLRSRMLQDYCQTGDGYTWTLAVVSAAGADVEISSGNDAASLVQGSPIDSPQNFSSDPARLAELDWGYCGRGRFGQWLNQPNRYLGLAFELPGNPNVYYGWAKVSEVASLDSYGHLQAIVMVQSFAYETVPGRRILAGQTTEN